MKAYRCLFNWRIVDIIIHGRKSLCKVYIRQPLKKRLTITPISVIIGGSHFDCRKYIAFFSIKWGWSRLTYLPLVFIISEKSIIMFYWTPYRGIDTFSFLYLRTALEIDTTPIEPLIGGLIPFGYKHTSYWHNLLNPL